MNFQNDAPIIKKIFDFYLIFHVESQKFPKSEKYTIAEKIKNIVLTVLELIIQAVSEKEKIFLLKKAQTKLDLLKLLIRLCCDLKIINSKKYLELEEKLQEIGRMLGGWIRSLKQ